MKRLRGIAKTGKALPEQSFTVLTNGDIVDDLAGSAGEHQDAIGKRGRVGQIMRDGDEGCAARRCEASDILAQ